MNVFWFPRAAPKTGKTCQAAAVATRRHAYQSERESINISWKKSPFHQEQSELSKQQLGSQFCISIMTRIRNQRANQAQALQTNRLPCYQSRQVDQVRAKGISHTNSNLNHQSLMRNQGWVLRRRARKHQPAERKVPEAADREGPGQVADNFATEEQSGSNQEQPEEGLQIQKVLILFKDTTGGLQSRAAAVLAEIQVPINSFFSVIDNLDGEGHSMEVQAPILDQQIFKVPIILPSASPEWIVDQAFRPSPWKKHRSQSRCMNEMQATKRFKVGKTK